MHNVKYSVTFTKTSTGVRTAYFISDVYDFEWGKYDGLGGFAANYAKAMETNGYNRPYNIYISYVLR
ncbi:hypothetical protein [Marinilactibacillus psychrotolerans]|uniref:hypothetical protein n=1 Tax=Marinilactibacillus psychrotolerans TaxID=191770 RepID=UPI00201D8F3C|nr:hypothetical protein [Marinilactibacillus psychrotolerans]